MSREKTLLSGTRTTRRGRTPSPINIVRTFFEDAAGNLWVGTAGGGLEKFDRARESFTHYRSVRGDPRTLSNNFVMAVNQDSRGIIWVGTSNGLNRLDPKTGTFTTYSTGNGFPNSMIYGVLIDDGDQVWASTNAGLVRFNPNTSAVKSFDISDNLQANEFIGGSFFKTGSGEMFFGGVAGLNHFFPGEIVNNPFPPAVALTDFQIFNKSVPIGGRVQRPGRPAEGDLGSRRRSN